MKSIKSVGLLVLLSSFSTLYAGGKGTSGAQFLKIGIGARAVAMGEAYAGMEGDINLIYWNPAGLSRINTTRMSFLNKVWFQDIEYQNLMVGYPASSGFIALGINRLAMGSIDKYKNAGPTPTGESYSPVDMSAVVSYSREVDGIHFGANLKYISSNLDGEIASGLALDIGTMYKLGKLNTGLAIQNLGTGLKFRKESDPLPLNIKLGSVYKFGRSFTAALDFNLPNDNDFRVNTGVEYSRKYGENLVVALRTGYKTNTKGMDKADGLSAGFGLKYKKYQYDYAWVPSVLVPVHTVSFSMSFGDKGETIQEEYIIKGGKEKEKYYFNNATQLFQQGKYNAAIQEWQKVLEINPEHQLSKDKIKRAEEKLEERKRLMQEKPMVPPELGKNIAVSNFEGRPPISASEADFITDFFRSALVESGFFNVLDRSNMDKILAEQGFQQTGCTTEECAVQMGKLLNVNLIAIGKCGKLLSRFILTVNIINVESGRIVFSDSEDCYSESEIEKMATRIVEKIKDKLE